MATSQSIELDVEAASSTPRAVRRAFGLHFAARPQLDDLLLCLSEVVTNAVLYGGAPIRVVGHVVESGVRVEVSDGSTVLPVRQTPGPTSPTGRGLGLLDRLAKTWGVDVSGSGKTVWFEVDGASA
ncbi:MAG: hypothetical protein QOD72_1827 [Acidimicrobiaceae bacterium]|jgi:anti-sigma regulatory factor (Ser/Thr protein kinase)|nr:hypothetical protein [Acidimicrobiaceae bacterium]